MRNKYIITGKVFFDDDDSPLRHGRVLAFDRDLPSIEQRGLSPQLLGESEFDSNDLFQIEYGEEQLRGRKSSGVNGHRPSKGADLSFTVNGKQGSTLEISRIVVKDREYRPNQFIFNAPAELNVDIYVKKPDLNAISEYELLKGLFTSVAGDIPLEEMTMADVEFAIHNIGFDIDVSEATNGRFTDFEQGTQSLIWLVRSAMLNRLTHMDAEAFYGWGRMNIPLNLEDLTKAPILDVMLMRKISSIDNVTLQEALNNAISNNIIPDYIRERVDQNIRQLKSHGQLQREVLVQLVDQETGQWLEGCQVITIDSSGTEDNLGMDVTHRNGQFSFCFFEPEDVPGGSPDRQFLFKVTMPDGTKLPESDPVSISPNHPEGELLQVSIRVPRSYSSTLEALQLEGLINLPSELISTLKEHGIKDFANIRRAGGLSSILNLAKGDTDVLSRLDSLADLDRILPDLEAGKGLLEKGYDGVFSIARSDRGEFVENTRDLLGNYKAMEVHAAASAQTNFLNNQVIHSLAMEANGLQSPERESQTVEKEKCGCSNCEAAVSTLAYLTDLMRYIYEHVKNAGKPVTIDFLTEEFFQPFDKLSISCSASEKKVKQIRLSIEVLRKYLKTKMFIPNYGPLSEGERDYLITAYTSLLNKIGTSYDELRQVKEEEERKALAERIGIDLSPGLTHSKDELYQLLLDLDRVTVGEKAITESKLEELFGLPDTQYNLLSNGAKLRDFNDQIVDWDLEKVVWNKNTDVNGSVYLSLSHDTSANLYRLNLFKDKQQTRLIATGESSWPEDKVALVPKNGSGLSGSVSYVFVKDSTSIEIVAIPRFLSWRLKHLRKQWQKEDRILNGYTLGELPVIDPDLTSQDDFRLVGSGEVNKALKRWLARRAEVDSLLTKTRTIRESHQADQDRGRDALLLEIFNKTFAKLKEVKADLDQDTDGEKKNLAAATVTKNLYLSLESFNRLMTLLDTAIVPEDAWTEIYVILTQAQKVARFPAWITEEQSDGIVLGPKEFWPSQIELDNLPKWLASQEARMVWQQTLEQRNQPAIVDPDLVPADYLLDPLNGPARELWKYRYEAIAQKIKKWADGLKLVVASSTGRLDYFDRLVQSVIGIPSSKLLEMDKRRLQGNKITGELVRLTLDQTAFNYLVKFYKSLINQAEILQTEWDDVFSILVQVWKKREYAHWQDEEAKAGLTLSQDFFQLPVAAEGGLMPDARELPKWRANRSEQRDWKDRLESRIDAERSIYLGMDEAIGAAEETALPDLRRYLIQLAAAPGESPEDTADRLTNRLLIDMRTASCQKTTRVAQAIETLQVLLFRLRTEKIASKTHWNVLRDAPAIRSGTQPLAMPLSFTGTQDTVMALVGEDSRAYIMFGSLMGGGPWMVAGDDNFKIAEGANLSLYCFEDKGDVYLLTRGIDGLIYFTFSTNGNGFSSWEPIGDFQFGPSAKLTVAGIVERESVHVFVSESDGQVYTNWWDGQWNSWIKVGEDHFHLSPSAILAAVSLKREVQLLVVGEDNKIYCAEVSEENVGNWTEVHSAPTGVTFVPGAALSGKGFFRGDQFIELAVVAKDGHLYRSSWNEMFYEWSPWLRQGELTVAQDQIITMAGDLTQLELFAVDQNGGLYEQISGNWKQIGDDKFDTAARPAVRLDSNGAEHLYIAQGNRVMTTSRNSSTEAWDLIHDVSLSLWAPRFEDQWEVIGSYASWRSYMFAFLYPENLLLPNLKRYKTPGFNKLIEKLSSRRNLTAGMACEAANEYSDYLKDVCSLNVAATCQTRTKIYKQGNCNGEQVTERDLLYLFGLTPSGNVYTSIYDSLDRSGYPQSPWKSWPFGEIVQEIGGAAAYTISSNSRFIYLFFIKKPSTPTGPSGVPDVKISFARYNLTIQEWDANITDLPDPPVYKTMLKIVVVQGLSEKFPPVLQIWPSSTKGGGGVTQRALNMAGDGWQPPLNTPEPEWDAFTWNWGAESPSGTSGIRDKVLPLLPITKLFAAYDTQWGYHVSSSRQFVNDRNNKLYRWYQDQLPSEEWLGLYVLASADSFDNYGNYKSRSAFAFFRQQGTHLPTCVRADHDNKVVIPNDGKLSYFPTPSSLVKVVPNYGAATPAEGQIVYLAKTGMMTATYCSPVGSASGSILGFNHPILVLPALPNNEPIRVAMPGQSQTLQAEQEQQLFQANHLASLSIRSLLEEAYYLVPIYIALRLQDSGEYRAALDWFRTVYDYTLPQEQRKIYYGLKQEESLTDLYNRPENWEVDPLDPHAVARTRRETYTRFTALSIARCLQQYADAEFTLDTSESVPRARELYTRELELLASTGLLNKSDHCDALIGQLEISIRESFREHANNPLYVTGVNRIIHNLRSVKNTKKLASIIYHLEEVYTDPAFNGDEKLKKSQSVVSAERVQKINNQTFKEAYTAQENGAQLHQAVMLKDVKVGELMEQAGKEASRNLQLRLSGRFKTELDNVVNYVNEADNISWSNEDDVNDFDILPVLRYPSHVFCIPPNPVLKSLKLHAELNLLKIRTCRNIAGLQRELDPYAAPTDTTSGLPMVGQGGQIILPGIRTFRPTLYRYTVLIERAKQLVNLAAQMEAVLLNTLEKSDQEAYNLLKARQDLGLSEANVRLQTLRVSEASHSITLAEKQKDRAEVTSNYYTGLIENGWLAAEQDALELLFEAAMAYELASKYSALSSLMSISAATVAAANLIDTDKDKVFSHTASALSSTASYFSSTAAQNQALSSLNQTLASYERRQQEWMYQKALGDKDVEIALQQITLANDQKQIVEQEKTIAELGTAYAKDTLEFLNNKFTNKELYDWMSKIIEDVYSFILQQANSIALLAQNQLAFERQEAPVALIQTDYWRAPKSDSDFSPNSGSIDRKGLTGSARLMRDISELDQYAFNTTKRKLQLTKTISLARLAPSEFSEFKSSGKITFHTPMELFDRDFPGHYMRLIRRVKTTVVATINSGLLGIRATLTSNGLSRVVVGPDVFQTVPVRRDPEYVALTSPINASGQFDLEPLQGDMLLPFEGNGVDATWEFKMPKASNQTDYRNITDVLITIEYTALDSYDYRLQMIQKLNPKQSADRAFSFRNEFPDQWFELHNPDGEARTPMTVKFTTDREDFPPNLENIKIQHVLLGFARSGDKTFELPITQLQFIEKGKQTTVGGSAVPIDGIISTRRGNGSDWTDLIGRVPVGEWELKLPNTEEVKNLFKDEMIDDIFLVITYSGWTPEWS